jgi:DNA-binding transcriptional ArsR family regulator
MKKSANPWSEMTRAAGEASEFLKALAHEHRLLALCLIMDGERTAQEIEAFVGIKQSAMSAQLLKLKAMGLVETRRDGKNVFYRIADERVRGMIGLLRKTFCA